MNNIATHQAPAWRARANFIVRCDLSPSGMAGRFEQMWALKKNATVFEICCIPFFSYSTALGDTVECDHEYTIQRVIEKAGHKTLRVAVANESNLGRLHEILHGWVEDAKLLCEWYSPGYLAVDLPPGAQSQPNLSLLEELHEAGEISMEIDE